MAGLCFQTGRSVVGQAAHHRNPVPAQEGSLGLGQRGRPNAVDDRQVGLRSQLGGESGGDGAVEEVGTERRWRHHPEQQLASRSHRHGLGRSHATEVDDQELMAPAQQPDHGLEDAGRNRSAQPWLGAAGQHRQTTEVLQMPVDQVVVDKCQRGLMGQVVEGAILVEVELGGHRPRDGVGVDEANRHSLISQPNGQIDAEEGHPGRSPSPGDSHHATGTGSIDEFAGAVDQVSSAGGLPPEPQPAHGAEVTESDPLEQATEWLGAWIERRAEAGLETARSAPGQVIAPAGTAQIGWVASSNSHEVTSLGVTAIVIVCDGASTATSRTDWASGTTQPTPAVPWQRSAPGAIAPVSSPQTESRSTLVPGLRSDGIDARLRVTSRTPDRDPSTTSDLRMTEPAGMATSATEPWISR